MEISYSINRYNNEGRLFEKGVYLHIEPSTILRFYSSIELDQFAKDILNTLPEITEAEKE
jgi:hypothetical protein